MRQKWLFWGSIVLALIIIFIAAVFPAQSEDIFMYLAAGRRFFVSGSFPTTDPFIFSMPDFAWHMSHEWLSYIISYFLYCFFGFGGLILIKALFITGICYLTVQTAVDKDFRSWVVPLVVVLVGAAASHRFILRSSLFSDLFTALTLYWLLIPKRNQKWLWFFPATFVFWVNVHPAFPIGLGLIAIFWVFRINNYKSVEFIKLSKALLLSVLACQLNPLGWKGFIYPVTKSLSEEWQIFRNNNYEWLPTFTSIYGKTIEAKILLLIMAAALLAWVWNWHKKSYRDLLIVCFLIFVGAYAARFAATASYSLGVICVYLLSSKSVEMGRVSKYMDKIVLVSLLAAVIFIFSNGYRGAAGHREFGVGVDHRFLPVTSAKVLEGLSGNVFNEFGWGSYLAWIWDGSPKIFIHGHIDRPSFYLNNYLGAGKSPERFQETVNKHKIDYFLLAKSKLLTNPKPIIYQQLTTHPWKMIYQDKISILFGRVNP